MQLYRIKSWGTTFENHETKKIKGSLPWVRLVTKRGGRTYRALVDRRRHPNGVAHYGVFVALLGIAAACEPRGVLVRDDGQALTIEDLELMTGMSPDILEEAIKRLASKEIGWLVPVNLPADPGVPGDGGSRGEETRSEESRGEDLPPRAGAREAGDERPQATPSGYPETTRVYGGLPQMPIDPAFEPDERSRAYAVERCLDPQLVRDRLVNGAQAKGWLRGDWQAAYREECDKHLEWRQRDGVSPRATQRPTSDRARPAAATSAKPKAGTRSVANDLKTALRGKVKP